MSDDMPKAVDVLADVFTRYISRHCEGVWPDHIPRPAFKAAQWWMETQEPAKQSEHAEPIYNPRGDLVAWQTPYHDRVKYTLQKFLAMDGLEQKTVLACIDEGIAYRGDDFSFFMEIVHHHRAMQRNPEAFKQRAAAMMARGWQKDFEGQ